MTDQTDVLIVGAGHAGAQAAIALRQAKFAGSITILGDEAELPYERPPLSKEYLAGAKAFERMLIRPADFWIGRGIVIRTGMRVVHVDAIAHRVTCADGTTVSYGKLIWATGGQPRRLNCGGHDLAGVHGIRSRADVDRLSQEITSAHDVVVIGGGYIGLEAAAALSKFGKRITLVEALDRVLARVAGEQLSRFYEAEHRAHGVDVRLSTAVDRIEGDGTSATGVRLATGELLPAQIVIVGIGIIPSTAPLADAGAVGGNGVDVDRHCRTSLPDIYAVGDCAAQENGFADGARIRVESVQNANDQAVVAARTIMDIDVDAPAVPWFWSNQYDLKLQTVGLSTGHDRTVLRGDPLARSFSIMYLKSGRVIALDCVNAVKDFVQGRKLVAARTLIDDRQYDEQLPV